MNRLEKYIFDIFTTEFPIRHSINIFYTSKQIQFIQQNEIWSKIWKLIYDQFEIMPEFNFDIILKVNSLLKFKFYQLLLHMKWSAQLLNEQYFGESQQNFKNKLQDEGILLKGCVHNLKKDEWIAYFKKQFNETVVISCQRKDCKYQLDYSFIKKILENDEEVNHISNLLQKQQLFDQYVKGLCIQFAQQNKNLVYCQKCNKYIERVIIQNDFAQCSCGQVYCFSCNKSHHYPVSCSEYDNWMLKRSDQQIMDFHRNFNTFKNELSDKLKYIHYILQIYENQLKDTDLFAIGSLIEDSITLLIKHLQLFYLRQKYSEQNFDKLVQIVEQQLKEFKILFQYKFIINKDELNVIKLNLTSQYQKNLEFYKTLLIQAMFSDEQQYNKEQYD